MSSVRTLARSSRGRPSASSWIPESFREGLSRLGAILKGGLLALLALALGAALYSHTPTDPSWNTAAPPGTPVANWLGSPGSHVADLLEQLFGAPAALLVFILGAWGWRLASDGELDLLAGRIVAVVLALVASCAGLATLAPVLPFGIAPDAGGVAGSLLASLLVEGLHGLTGPLVVGASLTFVALGALYLACALSLEEWRAVLALFHRALHVSVRALLRLFRRALLFLRSESSHDDASDGESDAPEPLPSRTHLPAILERSPSSPPAAAESAEGAAAPASRRAGTRRVKTAVIERAPPRTKARQESLPLTPASGYAAPSLDHLHWPEPNRAAQNDLSEDALEANAKNLETVLADFGVQGQVTRVSPGPVVTLYELEPSPGTRASRVISLADDIARNMSAASVRVSTVPGRNVIGIELPNRHREIVYLRDLLACDTWRDHKGALPLILGKDIAGAPVVVDLARMPHLLIAGTTGSGKSVAMNTMVLSLIYRLSPQQCRFIMIDPKMLELSLYEGIPHLLTPVVTDSKKAIVALKWAARQMEERYGAMSKLGVRTIEAYNNRLREAAKNGENLTRTVQTGFDRETGQPVYEEQPLDLTPQPYIVVIVDEVADLMVTAGRDIETVVQRLAQMARAAGIHLIMATQRPSVDVITGTIKANFPARISFQVTSRIDSRTILGEQGAEQLLGQGDMLYMPTGGRVTRIHGPFVRDEEVESIVRALRAQGEPSYVSDVTEEEKTGGKDGEGGDSSGEEDDLYDKAVDMVAREGRVSISLVQRHLRIGYNRAATLVERMEEEGVVSAANATGRREVLTRSGNEG